MDIVYKFCTKIFFCLFNVDEKIVIEVSKVVWQTNNNNNNNNYRSLLIAAQNKAIMTNYIKVKIADVADVVIETKL